MEVKEVKAMKEFKFKIGSQSYNTTVNEQEDGMFEVVVNGKTYHVEVPESKSTPRPRVSAPAPTAAPTAGAPRAAAAAAVAGSVNAPLPGTITEVKVKEGQSVKKGDVLVVMEAMKMANDIVAESDGTVGKIHVAAGQSVNQGDVLVEFAGVAAPAAPTSPRGGAPTAAPKAAPAAGASVVVAPLPGTINKILVKEGQAVKSGETLLTMEAMKMENNIVAESDGTVKKIHVQPGAQVMGNDVLVELA